MSVSVKDFKKVVLKRVNPIQKEGKKPLVFVELVCGDSFETTGDLIYLRESWDVPTIVALKAMEKKLVHAVLAPNTFNGKTSFVVTDIVLA